MLLIPELMLLCVLSLHIEELIDKSCMEENMRAVETTEFLLWHLAFIHKNAPHRAAPAFL